MNEASDLAPDDFLGRVVEGRYRITSKLGEGGMGAVYEAEQIALSRQVALKVIHPSFSGDGEVRARFAREATASGQLDGHPHVASAVDFGTLPDGSLFLVMQLVKGPSLRDVVDRGRLPWERAVMFGMQIADALSAAHARGIVHRDLKPDNVAIVRREDDREVAKVLDFGIARVTPASGPELADTKLTRVGTIMGTPGYMAPEQAVGDSVDEKADLYALGVVLFEMLTGRIPFDGPDFTSIVAKQFAEAVPRPSEAADDPSIPVEVDELVTALLARTPSERPSGAIEVHRTLDRLVRASISPEGERPPTLRTSLPKREGDGASPALATIGARVATLRTSMEPTLAKLHASVAPALPEKLRPHTLRLVAAAIGLPLFLIVVGLAFGGEDAVIVPPPSPLVAPLVPVETSAPAPVLSPELTRAVETLVTGADAAARRQAATSIEAHATDPAMPPYAVQVAALENARNCRTRKEAIAGIVRVHDARAVPALERFSALPRRGCGFLNSRDCYACVREDLAQALEALRAP